MNVGSMAGGQSITLTASGAGFNTSTREANAVAVNGVPCAVTAVPDRQTLSCTAPSMYGYVNAEYWNLPASTVVFVDFVLQVGARWRYRHRGVLWMDGHAGWV